MTDWRRLRSIQRQLDTKTSQVEELLARRRVEVLRLVAAGETLSAIAGELGVTHAVVSRIVSKDRADG